MFLFLNRVCKAVLCAVWLGAAWMAWQQRERLLPAWDLLQLWTHRDSGGLAELTRMSGTVTSAALAESETHSTISRRGSSLNS